MCGVCGFRFALSELNMGIQTVDLLNFRSVVSIFEIDLLICLALFLSLAHLFVVRVCACRVVIHSSYVCVCVRALVCVCVCVSARLCVFVCVCV